MSEVECTRVPGELSERPNILFVPACDCPRCAAEPVEEYLEDETWLRVSGSRQRLHVEALTLGETGRALLG